MDFCTECGRSLGGEWHYCPSCGAPVSTTPQSARDADADESRPDQQNVRRRALTWLGAPFKTRRRKVLSLGIVVALLLVCTGDWYVRNRALSDLIDRSEAADAAIEPYEGAIDSECGELTGSSLADCIADSSSLERDAFTALEDLIPARRKIADVFVPFWQRSIRKAKDRNLEYYDAYEDFLRDQSAGNYSDAGYPEIKAAFDSAQPAFRDAVPILPIFHLEKRARDLYPDE
jgi:zinc-ribbon domain